MARFPTDAPLERVIKAFERLGFRLVRQGNHLAMVREEPDGTRTPLTIPAHRRPSVNATPHSDTGSDTQRCFYEGIRGQLRRANLHSGPSSS